MTTDRAPAPATDRPLTSGDDELIERGLRMIRAYDAVRFLRDALSATTARVTGYDWNADHDGITKQQGDAFSVAERVFADLNAAVDAIPEIDLSQCRVCGGTGKIEEAAKTEGANQHSACVRTCDECDGCGFSSDDEDAEPARPAASDEGVGRAIDHLTARLNKPGAFRVDDEPHLRAILAALASPPVSERERELSFLLDRLTDFENALGESAERIVREWHGHVAPSIARLSALTAQPAGEGK